MRAFLSVSLVLLGGILYTPCAKAQTVVAQPAQPRPPVGAAQPAINVRLEFRRATSEEFAQKTMDALANKENFIFAEIGKDGSAWGYNETCIVRVFAMPFKDGVNLLMVCCGKEKQESERLGNALWTHLTLDTPANPLAPKQHKCKDATRKPCGLCLRSSFEQRNVISTVRLFLPAALIVMEKQGVTTNPVGPGLVLGAHPPSKSLIAVVGTQGPNEANVQIGAIAISTDESEADRLQNVIRAGAVKVLFE